MWALITMLIYSFALHPGLLPALRRPRPFHWFVLLAFLSVLFTYFGGEFPLGRSAFLRLGRATRRFSREKGEK